MSKIFILFFVLLVAVSGCLNGAVESTTSTSTLICSWEPSAAARGQCITKVAAERNDSTLCKIIEDEIWVDTCIRNVAENKLDERLCSMIKNAAANAECIKAIAWETGEGETCRLMNESTQKDSCYYASAVRHSNPGVCDRVESDSSKYRCRAITTRDASECENITDGKARDWCYLKLASINPSKSSCANIVSVERKDECYIVLAEKLFDVGFCTKVVDSGRQKVCTEKAKNASDNLKTMQKSFGLNDSIKISPK